MVDGIKDKTPTSTVKTYKWKVIFQANEIESKQE
jgi:hypothetical protein